MHTDVPYRGSLATDLMEPARPAADQLVLDMLAEHVFQRGELHETREGVCRVGPPLAAQLVRFALPLGARSRRTPSSSQGRCSGPTITPRQSLGGAIERR